MAIHNFRWADERFIDELLDPEELVKRVPRLETFFDGIQQMKALQAEISTLGKYTRQSGFTKDFSMQRIATIPYSVAAAIKEIDPEFFKSPAKVERFLKAHPEYDTRTKVL